MTEATQTPEVTSPLAAIVFDRDEEPDAPLIAFAEALAGRGGRLAGFVQERAADNGSCTLKDVWLRDIVTGETLGIMQDLGRDASACRVDAQAIARAAGRLGAALAAGADLVLVNRFGKLEAEGGGMLAEIGRAFSDGVPLIVCVPRRCLESWDAFACGLDAKLAPTRAAIEAWWTALAAPSSSRAAA